MAASSVPELCGQSVEAYFETLPIGATGAGRQDFDEQLEEFSPENRAKWVKFNRLVKVQIAERLQNEKFMVQRSTRP
ncbi:MAG: hypothetical protein DMF04_10080 [Verrucomicrobia bacterium]|jgi:hypothetical protein|nr:MAG: hypothetical protein DMF04_10080 [Verrucomicrobiota bacterium]